VNVFESFPIRTDVYLAQGIVAPDGRHVILTNVVPERAFGLKDDAYPMPNVDPNFSIPFSYVQDNTTESNAANSPLKNPLTSVR
jgi:hypothetical protein